MKDAGIGGATIFSLADTVTPWAGVILKSPTPEIVTFTEPWWAMVRHAATECRRLGLELILHNCAGYESSGGAVDHARTLHAGGRLVRAAGTGWRTHHGNACPRRGRPSSTCAVSDGVYSVARQGRHSCRRRAALVLPPTSLCLRFLPPARPGGTRSAT